MARRKTLPESVRVKYSLAERLSALRSELYGERGGPELARRLCLPIRTWYNYEAGVTVPAEVVLKIIELTSVEPMWLLHGTGPKYRAIRHNRHDTEAGSSRSVGVLLCTALEILEQEESTPRPGANREPESQSTEEAESGGGVVLLSVDDSPGEPLTEKSGPRFVAARREWLAAERDCRCIRVVGNSMAPIVADGAYVAFAKSEETLASLDGKMVVAWIKDEPHVRWFQLHGHLVLLRAENAATDPPQLLLNMEENLENVRFRRVLWINTPH